MERVEKKKNHGVEKAEKDGQYIVKVKKERETQRGKEGEWCLKNR